MDAEQLTAAVDAIGARVAVLERDLGARVAALEVRLAQPSDTATVVTSPMPAAPPPQMPAAAPPPPAPPPPPPPPFPTPVAAPVPPPVGAAPAPSPPTTPGPPAPPSHPGLTEPAAARASAESTPLDVERLVRWAGILLVTLAAVFFVTTAIQRGWIGPELQLTAATLGGLAMVGAADLLRTRSRPWSGSLGVGGVVVLGACAVASHTWLDLTSPLGALALVVVASAIGWAAAVRLGQEPVAVATGLSALGWPGLFGVLGDVDLVAAAGWLAAVVVVSTALGALRQWWRMRLGLSWLAAAGFTIFVLVQISDDVAVDHPIGFVVAAIVAISLWVGPATQRWRADASTSRALDARAVAAVPLWAWLTVGAMAELESNLSIGLLGIALALVSMGAAAGLTIMRRLSPVLALSHLLGAAAAVALSLAVLFDGPVLMVALAAHAAVSIVLALRFRDPATAVLAAMTGAVAGLMTAVGIAEAIDRQELAIGDAVAQLAVIAATAVAAWYAHRTSRREVAQILFWPAWLGAMAWLAAVVEVSTDLASVLALTWMAAAVIAVAVARHLPAIRAAGFATGALALAIVAVDAVAVIEAGDYLIASLFQAVTLVGAATGVWLAGRAVGRTAGTIAFVATWATGLVWVASILTPGPQPLAAISVAWAVLAVGAIVAGLMAGLATVRTVGLVTLGVVLVKLLTVDLAGVDVLWRAGLFLVIGAGLMWLAWALPKLADRPANGAATTGKQTPNENEKQPNEIGLPGYPDGDF
ncbi:MAG: DUF2339 domain-containing protein [Actinomycetota bacterium]